MCCTKVASQHPDLEKNFEGRATIEDLDDNYKAMIFFFFIDRNPPLGVSQISKRVYTYLAQSIIIGNVSKIQMTKMPICPKYYAQ